MKVNLVIDSIFLIGYNTAMNKETKQLNILLAVMVAVGILSPFIVGNTTRQVQPIQIDVAEMEVTQEVYDAIYAAAASCDINDTLRVALADNKVSYTEAKDIGEQCKQQMLDSAKQPFERGRLEQQMNYIIDGGVAM